MHRIYQKHGIPPHEFYQYEERYKTFMYASELLVLDEENKQLKEDEKTAKRLRSQRKRRR